MLIWADETALPAASAALEWLPAGMKAQVWLEVQHTEDRQALNTAARARITWLVRDEGAPAGLEAVRAAELPEGAPYVWIAGESSQVRALRRHLVQERRFDRRRVTFVGYWRRGMSEEQAARGDGHRGRVAGRRQGAVRTPHTPNCPPAGRKRPPGTRKSDNLCVPRGARDNPM